MRKPNTDQQFRALCSFYVDRRIIEGVVPYAVLSDIEIKESDIFLKHHLADREKSVLPHAEACAELLYRNPGMSETEWWELYTNEEAFAAYVAMTRDSLRRFVGPASVGKKNRL